MTKAGAKPAVDASAVPADLAKLAGTLADMQEMLTALRAENAQLREQVDAQTTAAEHHQVRHAAKNAFHAIQGSELVVGIRNVSDNVVGIKGWPEGEPDISLNADVPGSDNTSAVITYVHWRRLRSGPFVKQGLIIRDDSILGNAFNAAPPDQPGDLPAEAAINVILDPAAWIADRSEEDLIRDIAALTSDDSLRRLRGYIDRSLYAIQRQLTNPWSAEAAQEAVARLPAKLQKVDDLVTRKLERDDPDGGAPLANLELSQMDVQRMRSMRTRR
jgi:hypothetical protein